MSEPLSKYEYRVCWRREHDNRKRTRIYQTQQGAEDFARFLEIGSEYPQDGSVLGDNLERVGEVAEVFIERRVVGEWVSG